MAQQKTKQPKYIWQLKNWTDFTWRSDELIKLLGQARAVQTSLLSKIRNLGFEEQS